MADWLELPTGGPGGGELREEPRQRRPADERMLAGERLYYEGEFEQAAGEFRSARRHDPSHFDAWAAEVDALLRAGDLPRAAATADEALKSFGQVPVFYAAKALVLAHKGDIEAAYEHSDIAVKHRGEGVFTWLARAEVVLASGAWGGQASAGACIEKACQADPTHWRASFRAALCLIRWGHAGDALERLGQVAERVPRNPFVWKRMGDCYRALGQQGAARECYRAALARRRDYAPAGEALAEMTHWGRLRRWVSGLLKRKSAIRNP
ncbi:MAG: tetratricopeptide repeat protein [Planctomycetes bacterium]|nr:tetratricopeptide repeat protein [Planctomycetota bacterium]